MDNSTQQSNTETSKDLSCAQNYQSREPIIHPICEKTSVEMAQVDAQKAQTVDSFILSYVNSQ